MHKLNVQASVNYFHKTFTGGSKAYWLFIGLPPFSINQFHTYCTPGGGCARLKNTPNLCKNHKCRLLYYKWNNLDSGVIKLMPTGGKAMAQLSIQTAWKYQRYAQKWSSAVLINFDK